MIRIDCLGLPGFPYGLAAVEKQKLIARGLVEAGADVTVICNRWGSFNSENLKRKGDFLGIKYIYTTPVVIKPKSFLARRFVVIYGWLNEILKLMARKQDIFLVSSEDFFHVLVYSLIARLKGKKIFLTYVEDVNVLFNNSWLNNLKVKLFNKYTWKMLDGAFPISEYLMESVRVSNPSLPIMKLPTLVDFDLFEEEKKSGDKYFLFCGAAQYYEIIRFIINAFDRVDNKDYMLYLVANGSENETDILKKMIALSAKKDQVRLFGFLSYEELIRKYINASGLLIPLRNNIRDIARFPHKIGEYCASRVPIISTNFGEIRFYFTDRQSAFLADDFDEAEFASQMQYVADHPDAAVLSGKNSRKIGEENFDYRTMGKQILSFMASK